MLDWTGERFVPWAKEPAVAYEHLHRYIWASSLVKNKRVLDLASGEGYGADILARDAAFVCGIDIDETAIRHASEKYTRPNLRFLAGSLACVPVSSQAAFDVIVCFEAIEHIQEHEELLREVKRLLKPEGTFIVSTPNKEVYRDDEPPNPFHVRELTFDQFNTLLTGYFANVRYLGQRVHPVSSLWPIGTAGARVKEYTVERMNDGFVSLENDKRVAVYFVAVASDVPGSDFEGSVLVDHSNELIHSKDRESQSLRQELAWRESCVQELEKTVAARAGVIAQQAKELEIVSTELGLRRHELEEIHQSRGWKLVLKLRAVRDRLKHFFLPPPTPS
jgi:SAM-dependent methyltransferase